MPKLLETKNYELDQLAHMFLPVFKKYSYREVLNKVDKNLDYAAQALNKIERHPERYDLDVEHDDPWFARFKIEAPLATKQPTYSQKLQNALFALSSNTVLTDSQKAVFAGIAKNKSWVSAIQGSAGSGKSFATAEFIKELLNKKAKILVLAPTHVAVTNINQLIDEARGTRYDQDMQLTRLVNNSISDITVATMRSWAFRNAKTIEQIVKYGHAATEEHFDVILVDEAFATSGSDLLNIFLQMFNYQVPVILIGDPHQLPSIDNRPDPLFDILNKNNHIYYAPKLSQVLRTKEATITAMASAIMDNKMAGLASLYAKPDPTSTAAAELMTPSDFENQYWIEMFMAANTARKLVTNPFASMILVPTNVLKDTLNQMVQELRINLEQINPKDALELPNGQIIYKDDVLMVKEQQEVNDWSKGSKAKARLRGASRIQVTNLFPVRDARGFNKPYNRFKKQHLSFRDHNYKIEIYSPDLNRHLVVDLFNFSSSGYNPGMYNPDVHELYKDLPLGYAATVNKVQGLSIDHVQIYLDQIYPHLSRNLLYSGITRARESVKLIADPKVLKSTMNRTENQTLGYNKGNSQNKKE